MMLGLDLDLHYSVSLISKKANTLLILLLSHKASEEEWEAGDKVIVKISLKVHWINLGVFLDA